MKDEPALEAGDARSRDAAYGRWFWLGLFTVIMVLAGARTTMISVLPGALIYGIWELRQRGRLHLTPPVWIIGGIMLLLLIGLGVLQFGNGTHGLLSQRLDLWRIALNAYRDHPFVERLDP